MVSQAWCSPFESSTRKIEIGRCFKCEASLFYIRSFKLLRLHSKIVSKKSISQIHRYDFYQTLVCVCWGAGICHKKVFLPCGSEKLESHCCPFILSLKIQLILKTSPFYRGCIWLDRSPFSRKETGPFHHQGSIDGALAAGLAGCVFVKVSWVISLLSLLVLGFLLFGLSPRTLEALLVVGAMADIPTQHTNFGSLQFRDCFPSFQKRWLLGKGAFPIQQEIISSFYFAGGFLLS